MARAQLGELVREQGVDRDAGHGVGRVRTLLHDADGVDDRLRAEIVERGGEARGVARVDAGIGVTRVEAPQRGVGREVAAHRHAHVVRASEHAQELVPEHAVAARDQDAHGVSVTRLPMGFNAFSGAGMEGGIIA